MTTDFVIVAGLAGFLATIVLVCVVALIRRQPRTMPAEERMSLVEQRIAQTEHHVANVRMTLGGLPTKEHLHKLELQVSELSGDLKRTNETTLSTSRAVERIESFLLNTASQNLSSPPTPAPTTPAKDTP